MKIQEGDQAVFDRGEDGYSFINTPSSPSGQWRWLGKVIGYKNLVGDRFYPPLRKRPVSPVPSRGLKRRSMVVFGSFRPKMAFSPVVIAHEYEKYPHLPNMLEVKVSVGQEHDHEQGHFLYSDLHTFNETKAARQALKKTTLYRQVRITNGLDRDSLEWRQPRDYWCYDEVTLWRPSRGVHFMIEPIAIMKEVCASDALVRQNPSLPSLEFHVPFLISQIGRNLRRYYDPLLHYGHRQLHPSRIADYTGSHKHKLKLQRNPYAHLLRDAPFIARILSQPHGPDYLPPPNDSTFGTRDCQRWLYLEIYNPETGHVQNRWLKTSLELEHAKRLVTALQDEGLRYVLSHFDSDYLIALLPLVVRRQLAVLSRTFQRRVRHLLWDTSPEAGDDEAQAAIGTVVRNSEKIIRALVERQQKALADGMSLNDLPERIFVGANLLHRFLKAEFVYLRRRKSKPRKPRKREVGTRKKTFSNPKKSFTGSLYVVANRDPNPVQALRELLWQRGLPPKTHQRFEKVFQTKRNYRELDDIKRELENRCAHAHKWITSNLGKLPLPLRRHFPSNELVRRLCHGLSVVDLSAARKAFADSSPAAPESLPHGWDYLTINVTGPGPGPKDSIGAEILVMLEEARQLGLELKSQRTDYNQRHKELSRTYVELDSLLKCARPTKPITHRG